MRFLTFLLIGIDILELNLCLPFNYSVQVMANFFLVLTVSSIFLLSILFFFLFFLPAQSYAQTISLATDEPNVDKNSKNLQQNIEIFVVHVNALKSLHKFHMNLQLLEKPMANVHLRNIVSLR